MLVLSRKIAETIVVDDRIRIKVLRINRNTISVGIEAPRDVSVWRGELAPSALADAAGERTPTSELASEREWTRSA